MNAEHTPANPALRFCPLDLGVVARVRALVVSLYQKFYHPYILQWTKPTTEKLTGSCEPSRFSRPTDSKSEKVYHLHIISGKAKFRGDLQMGLRPIGRP